VLTLGRFPVSATTSSPAAPHDAAPPGTASRGAVLAAA